MIPIRTERRLSGRPVVTWIIGLICSAAMVRLVLMPDDRAVAALEALGVVPARFLAAPLSPAQLVTLVTSAFLHAGWVHLGGNLLYLAVFGPTVEIRLGRLRYTLLYLVSGAAGALLHTLTHPTSTVPLVGASGAIAGILGHTWCSSRGARSRRSFPSSSSSRLRRCQRPSSSRSGSRFRSPRYWHQSPREQRARSRGTRT